jgi:putative DNA primase/helicase
MLFLDEIGEAEPEAFFKIIYMLANGVTKTRADRKGNAKATTYFTVLAQSTGEIGLEAKLAEKNKKAKGGQLIRMIELNADQGKGLNTFDILNINPYTQTAFTSGRDQAEYLKLHAQENSGVLIDNFLQKVVSRTKDYKDSLQAAKVVWLKRKLTGNETVEVTRVAKRFSTIFASGVIAVELELIPHSIQEIETCIDAMFKNWLERYGGDTSYEFKVMLEDLYRLTIEQQYARFCNAHPEPEERDNIPKEKAGYWKMEMNAEGDKVLSEFWIYPKVFEREVLKGRDKKVFYPMLVNRGYLARADYKHYTHLKRPKKEPMQRFVIISISALLTTRD